MNIIIFYEHKVRELPMLRKLKEGLEQQGNKVSIYSIVFEWFDAYKFALDHGVDVLVVPWCYEKGHFWSYSPFWEINPNVKMINLHHEQITAPLTEAVILPRDQEAASVPYHFVWADYFGYRLEAAGVPKEKIYKVGSIRANQVSEAAVSREELAERYGLDPRKEWILFAESRRIDSNTIEKATNDFVDRVGVPRRDVEDFLDRWKESIAVFQDQLKSLPDTFFDQYEFIYRPHPGSTIEFDLGSHAKIIYALPIADWLQVSDVFCTWQSTSSFEAEIAGLPVLVHECVPIPEIERMPGVSDYPKITNLNEITPQLVNAVREDLELHPLYPEFLGPISGETVQNYVEAIELIGEKSVQDQMIPYDRKMVWREQVFERVVKTLNRMNLIKVLKWPNTAYAMDEDIPFGDAQCEGLHE